MIFILNSNPIILRFYASLLFKMVLEICLSIKKKKKKVSETGLVEGTEFELPFYNLFPICCFKNP